MKAVQWTFEKSKKGITAGTMVFEGSLPSRMRDEFYKYCDGFLIKAIPNFTVCRKSLDYVVDYNSNPQVREFVSTLSIYEKDILADYWALEWFKRETQVASRINAALQNSGSFKSHSEALNLKAKESYLDGLRVKVSQKCTDYQLMDLSVLNY